MNRWCVPSELVAARELPLVWAGGAALSFPSGGMYCIHRKKAKPPCLASAFDSSMRSPSFSVTLSSVLVMIEMSLHRAAGASKITGGGAVDERAP